MMINFDELYTKAVNDFEPISQVVSDTLWFFVGLLTFLNKQLRF